MHSKQPKQKGIQDQIKDCNYGELPSELNIRKKLHVTAHFVCTFDLQNIYLDKNYPWEGTIVEHDFLVLHMYHTTLSDSWCVDVESY